MTFVAFDLCRFRSAVRNFAKLASVLALAASPFVEAQTAIPLANETVVTSVTAVPVGGVRDAAGNTYVLTSLGAVYKLPAGCLDYSAICAGTPIIGAPPSGIVTSIAVDTAGAVYTVNTTSGAVAKYLAAGTSYSGTVLFTDANSPFGIDVDGAGRVYLSDSHGINGYLAGSSSAVQLFGGVSAQYKLLRLDGLGNLYASSVSPFGTYAVQRFNAVANDQFSYGGLVQVVNNQDNVITALAVSPHGVFYAAAGAKVFQAPVLCPTGTTTDVSTCTYALTGVTTAAALVNDGHDGIYAYDLLSASNRVVDYTSAAGNFGNVAFNATATGVTSYFGFTSQGVLGAVTTTTQGNVLGSYSTILGGCTSGTSYNVGDVCAVGSTVRATALGLIGGAAVLSDNTMPGKQLALALLTANGIGSRAAQFPATSNNIFGIFQPVALGGDRFGNLFAASSDGALYKVAAGSTQGTLIVPSYTTHFYDIAVDSAGHVLFTNEQDGTVIRVNADNSLSTVATVSAGSGMTIDSDDNLYVVTKTAVVKLTLQPDGSYTQSTVYSGLSWQYGYQDVAIDGDRNLYVANYSGFTIVKLTLSAGAYTANNIASGLANPNHIVVEPSGAVYYSTIYGAIGRLAPNADGTYTRTELKPPHSNFSPYGASGLVIDGLGHLYYADNSISQIVEIDTTNPLRVVLPNTVSGSVSAPVTVTFANSGNLPLNFAVPASGNNPAITAPFSLSKSTCPSVGSTGTALSLERGAACTEEIVFSPLSTGSITGSLAFTDDALQTANAAQVFVLSGIGLQAPQTITFAQPASPVLLSTTAPLAASSTSGLPVTYSIISGPATLAGSTVTFTASGNVVIQADQVGNTTYAAAAPVRVTYQVQVVASTYTVPTSTAVGATASAVTVSLNFLAPSSTLAATSAAAIKVVTQGATGLDFAFAAGGTCTAGSTYTNVQSCTVNVNFIPTVPGRRLGAVSLYDGNGVLLAQSFVNGTATAPQALFTRGVSTNFVTTSNGDFRGPSTDASGNIFVADSIGNLFRFDQAGTQHVLGTFVPKGGQATAVDGAGNVYFIDGTGVEPSLLELVGGAGTPVTVALVGKPDNALAVDPSGNLYYTNQSGIHKVTVATGVDTIYAPALHGERYISLAFDASGNLFAAVYSYASGNITEVAAGSQAVTLVAYPRQPQGVAVDAAGDLYTNSDNGLTSRFQNGTRAVTSLDGAQCCGLAIRQDGGLAFTGNGGTVGVIDRTHTATLGLSAKAGSSTSAAQATSQFFQIENDGNAPLILSAITASTSFSLDPSTGCAVGTPLAPGAECTVVVNFTAPMALGTTNGTVTVTSNSLNVASSNLVANLNGASVAPALAGFTFTGIPASIVAGTSVGPVTVQAVDQTGVVFPGFSGTLSLSQVGDNSAAVVYPANVVLTNGVGTFSFTPVSSGGHSITVQANNSYVLSQYFAVTPAAAIGLTASAQPITTHTNTVFSVGGVSTIDQYGNSPAQSISVLATVGTGTGGASATLVTPAPFNTPASPLFQANGSAGSFTITLSAVGLPPVVLNVTTVLQDTFLVTVNTDDPAGITIQPETIHKPASLFISRNLAANCVNQTAGATYQTGATTNAKCSLRSALAASDQTLDAVIAFGSNVASSGTSGTIVLLARLNSNTPVTISGPGSAALTLNGQADGGIYFNSYKRSILSGLTLLNSSKSDAVYNGGGTITINDVIFQGNTGYLAAELNGSATISNSLFSSNSPNSGSVVYSGNQLALSNVVFKSNVGHDLYVDQGSTFSIVNSTFSKTIAATVDNINGDPTNGAVLYANQATGNITSSTVTDNSGVNASAVYLQNGAVVTLANSTFTANTSTGTGTFGGDGSGGNMLTVRNSTLYGNSQGAAGGQITTPASILNSIVAGQNGAAASTGNCVGCTLSGSNVIDVDPKLMALGNYVSPATQIPVLQTLLPMTGSPAICAGALATDTVDERGYARPTTTGAKACFDVGAVQTAYSIALTQQPTASQVGSIITPAPTVQITEHAMPISGSSVVATASAGLLAGTTTQTTGSTGTATFTDLSISPSGSETLSFATGNLSATSVAFTVIQVPVVVTFPQPADIVYGKLLGSQQLTATATRAGNVPVPGTFVYSPAAGTLLNAGTNVLSVQFTPTSAAIFVTPTAVQTNLLVTPSATSLQLVSSTANALPGTSVNFTATVAAVSGPVPSGSVIFSEGSTALGTAALVNGVASFSTAMLGTASHTITATYQTNGNDATSTASLIEVVADPFTLTDGGQTSFALTLNSGGSASTSITVSPTGKFTGTVTLSCSNLPQNTGCTFGSTSLNFTGNGDPQTVTLTVRSQVTTAALTLHKAAFESHLATMFWLPCLLLAGVGVGGRRLRGKSRLIVLPLVTLILASFTGLSGCGGRAAVITPAGTYTMNVVAKTGNTTQMLPITITVK